MKVNLRELLTANEEIFNLAIEELNIKDENEANTTKQQIESLEEEISSKARLVLGDLKLEESDNFNQIYLGLMQKMNQLNGVCLDFLDLKDNSSSDQIVDRTIQIMTDLNLFKQKTFTLKDSTAEEIIIKNPPVNLVNHFDLKDVQELIKLEGLEKIFIAIRFSEDEEWLNNFNQSLSNLKKDDFKSKNIKVIALDERYQSLVTDFIYKKKHNLTHSKEFGVVGILPTLDIDSYEFGLPLKLILMIFHYIYEVDLYSSFFKKIDSKNFGKIIADTLNASPNTKNKIVMADGSVKWRVIQRYFAKISDLKDHPELTEPHLHPEDLHWRKAEEAAAKLIPALDAWQHLDYVAFQTDDFKNTISLNLVDLSFSFANKKRFGEQETYHMREALWNEIFSRFMGEPRLKEELLENLNNQLISV